MKQRLDKALVQKGLVSTRSQAESYIRLGKVKVDGRVVTKAGTLIDNEKLEITQKEQYVSRAALKLESVSKEFGVDFRGKIVLDVGSSTGGFTDFALKNGAKKVIAIDVGTKQLHPTLRGNQKIELHEQTDIRNVAKLSSIPDVVVIDVSFVSLRDILPRVNNLIAKNTLVIAMVKPQFEAKVSSVKHKGIIKNESIRRDILRDFEQWSKDHFVIQKKQDSAVSGEKGNRERFYLMRKTQAKNQR